MTWFAGLGLLLACAPLALAEGQPTVTEAKLGVEPNLTRVELSLTGAPEFRLFTLADPDRVVIDLSQVGWKVPGGKKLQGHGLVAGLRYGLFKAGTSRIVLDLAAPAAVTDARILPADGGQPVRLAIDLRPSDTNAYKASVQTVLFASAGAAVPAGPGAAPEPGSVNPVLGAPAAAAPADGGKAAPAVADAAKPAKPAAQPAASKPLAAAAEAPKPLIVIDPGHGGIDPGALGSHTMEKNITLAVAKQLQKTLLATGRFRVVLTRDKDVFIPLRDRFKIARDKGADLFISLHADSNPGTLARGASVYTLSDKASDAEAEALATKENKSDVINGVDLSQQSQTVSGILIDLAQRETINLSSRFASILVSDLRNDTMMLQNSHRFAGFAVLKAPDVPSVLLEMGYISSSDDERLLTDPKHQKKLSESITHAIEDYFDWRDMIRRT
ncbi:MAG TPA: N-acetylmuramoyl-L-alanine amidase [Dongiaceae bacterium]|nr:N-acetylmuramoyl-L-alanine amidase [Dongiaceae bacterium]